VSFPKALWLHGICARGWERREDGGHRRHSLEQGRRAARWLTRVDNGGDEVDKWRGAPFI
jgi:uncharacterized protein (DUF2384 family)